MRRPLALVLLLACAPAFAAESAGVSRVNVRKLALIPTIAGAASLLTGVGLLIATAVRPDESMQHAGWTAFGVGLGLIVVGALTCALGGAPPKVTATVTLVPGGAGLAAAGVW